MGCSPLSVVLTRLVSEQIREYSRYREKKLSTYEIRLVIAQNIGLSATGQM